MDKLKYIGYAALVLIAFIAGAQLRGCGRGAPCDNQVTRSDTVISYITRRDTMLRLAYRGVPKPRQIQRSNEQISQASQEARLPIDTAIYVDTLHRPNEYDAVIQDTVAGSRIIGRSIWWANRTPIEQRTVTNTVSVVKKQPLLKVYVGAAVYARVQPVYSADIAPAASLIESDKYMIDLGYKLLSCELQCGVKVKISAGK